MKDKKLWKQLARDGIALGIAGLISIFLWPVSCLLGNESDWIYKLSSQLSWVFTLSFALTFYYFIKAANEDTRREDEIRTEQTTAWTLLNNAADTKAQKIISKAKNTSLPLKDDSLGDLNRAYDEASCTLKTLIKIQMLPPWKKTLLRNEEDGIIEIYGDLECFGDGIRRVYLYDNFKIAPSPKNVSFASVSDEFIDKLIDDAAVKIAEEITIIKSSIEAKARPSSSPSLSNALDAISDQPLEVTKVVLFAPLLESAGTESFTL